MINSLAVTAPPSAPKPERARHENVCPHGPYALEFNFLVMWRAWALGCSSGRQPWFSDLVPGGALSGQLLSLPPALGTRRGPQAHLWFLLLPSSLTCTEHAHVTVAAWTKQLSVLLLPRSRMPFKARMGPHGHPSGVTPHCSITLKPSLQQTSCWPSVASAKAQEYSKVVFFESLV